MTSQPPAGPSEPPQPLQPPAPPAFNRSPYPQQGYNPGAPYVAGQPVYHQVSGPSNGLGTAGGVVGIVAAALCWIPYIGLILAVIAVPLAAVGLQRSNRMGGASKGMAITGLVCGLVALVINILILVAIYNTARSLGA